MTNQKNRFIQSLFGFLAAEDYILLKWWGQELMELPEGSDLDILVRPNVERKIASFLNQIEGIQGLRKEEKVGVCHYYLFFENGEFLQVDILTKFLRKDLIYLTTEEVFDSQRSIYGIKTYTMTKLFEHVVLFNFLNHSGLPQKYRTLFSNLPESVQYDLLYHFNLKYHTTFSSMEEIGKFDSSIQELLSQQIQQLPDNKLANRITHGIQYVKNYWNALKASKGGIITFSGVDGAGKSTIIKDTLHLLESKFRKQVIVLRHRPSLLPILSAWRHGKAEAEQRSINRLPRQGNNKNTLSSLFRFSYYYLDYLFGQLYVWAKFTRRGKIVLYDRYYYDFIIDGKRSNINLTTALPKNLFKFLRKPDLNFFLYADANTILQRKKELLANDIEQLTKGYQHLFQEFSSKHPGQYISIENLERQDTLSKIEQHFISYSIS